MLDHEFLSRIRELEISEALALCGQPPAMLLEIGAGAGVQARRLAQQGFEVTAIDLATSPYEAQRVFPVTDYDGRTIPFADRTFDVVYSSHVLMHIVDTEQFHREVQRVLKTGGRVVHVVPTACWRFWTMVMHYPANIAARLARACGPQPRNASAGDSAAAGAQAIAQTRKSWAQRLKLPRRIGETGNVLSEHLLFSDAGWRRNFQRHGWVPLAGEPNRIFYTGQMALSSRIPLAARHWLSYVLGSAGRLYVLRAAAPR